MSGTSADNAPEANPPTFGLSPLQRRLRVTTAILLVAIAGMIAFAYFHPFFRFHHPAVLTPKIRNAIAVQALLVLGYWTVCFCLVLAMLVVAWLDIREVRRRLAQTELAILRSIGAPSNLGDKRTGEP